VSRLVLMGGGPHAKVVLETLRAAGLYEVAGVLEPGAAARSLLGAPVLGGDDVLPRLRTEGVTHAIVTVGDNSLRRRLAARAQAAGLELAQAIHPRAAISPTARLAPGVVVMAGAVINAEATVGPLAIVNTGAVVDHDCRLDEAVHVGPGCALAGGVRVGLGAFLGAGVSAIPQVGVGRWAIVGAGAAVVRDIPDLAVAYGAPARVARTRNDIRSEDLAE
jgi:UDP-perosamine 4-acetyltransferase